MKYIKMFKNWYKELSTPAKGVFYGFSFTTTVWVLHSVFSPSAAAFFVISLMVSFFIWGFLEIIK